MIPVESHRNLAFIALGSNLGDSAVVLQKAMDMLQSLSTTPMLRSSLLRTEPVDCPPESPPFLNAVAGLCPRAGETPLTLFRRLREMEIQFGRQPKKIHNEPRILDLDLIAFGLEVVTLPELTVPHPRAHLRRFVLQPLSEIAPDFVFPGQKNCARDLLLALPLAD
jgi:2-amino-4-hydroxy-6-hydroxymethyldihydropteridine diphosphokinase